MHQQTTASRNAAPDTGTSRELKGSLAAFSGVPPTPYRKQFFWPASRCWWPPAPRWRFPPPSSR
jgi:hypothetical protein